MVYYFVLLIIVGCSFSLQQTPTQGRRENQDLQTFYKEIRSLRRRSDSAGIMIDRRLQVKAFLPIDVVSSRVVQSNYDDTKAVALYEYRISMKGININDAASL